MLLCAGGSLPFCRHTPDLQFFIHIGDGKSDLCSNTEPRIDATLYPHNLLSYAPR